MRPAELRDLLQDFYQERAALCARHEAGARLMSGYDVNNAYQYVIAREQTQLTWLYRALADLGGTASPAGQPAAPPAYDPTRDADAVLDEDAWQAEAFVTRWRGRVAALTHARHRRMLDVILGETLEHRRLFAQARAGRTDLLGRRPAGAGTGGGVLPTRWVE